MEIAQSQSRLIPVLDAVAGGSRREPSSPRPTFENGFCHLREWQKECYEALQHARFWSIQAATASGKTFAQIAIIHYRLEHDPTLRAVISVPQTMAGHGFREAKMVLPDGTRLNHAVLPENDLCASGNGKVGKIEHISQSFSKPSGRTRRQTVALRLQVMRRL